MADDPEVLPFATAAEWEAWLREHHETVTAGVWIRFARKASGIPTVTYREALQVALRFGWIDGQARGQDDPGTCSASRRAARAASGPSATATSPRP